MKQHLTPKQRLMRPITHIAAYIAIVLFSIMPVVYAQTVIEGVGTYSGTVVRINFTQGAIEERIPVTQAAADFWANRLVSSVPIEITMAFSPLSCTANSGTLGGASAQSVFRDFENAPQADVFYHVALANSYAGRDLNTFQSDIGMTFNSSIDNNNDCLQGINWDYSISLTAPSGFISFYQVILHEIAHGLGFSSFLNSSDGSLFNDSPDAYTLFLRDDNSNLNFADTSTTDAQRFSSYNR